MRNDLKVRNKNKLLGGLVLSVTFGILLVCIIDTMLWTIGVFATKISIVKGIGISLVFVVLHGMISWKIIKLKDKTKQ